MKKHFLSTAFLVSTCLGLASCGSENKSFDLFYAYSTENLLSDWNYLKMEDDLDKEMNAKFINRDYKLKFNLMQGENDGIQLMIHAKKYVNHFDFTLPSLTGPGGEIKSDNFSVAAVWYQEVNDSYEKDSFSGFYPDALIPLDKYKWRRMDHIEKDRNQALYFNFASTYDMKPGTYTGEGVLDIDGSKTKVPFEVTIYNAKMPEEVHWNSSYLIWYDEIVNGERENTSNELYLTYFEHVLKHRMTPDGLPEFMESEAKSYAEYYYKYIANDPRVTSTRMPGTNSEFNVEKNRQYLQALIDKNLEVRRAGDSNCNFFKKLYFYQDDEPPVANYPKVRAHDKAIFDLKKEMCVQLVDYPDLYESFTHMRNLVTIPYNDLLKATNDEGGVQCWCPQYQHFNSAEQRAKYKERQNSTDREFGENVWWYGCMDPISPYPSNHLDAQLLTGRVLSYMQFDYGIEGNIFWNVCFYSKQGLHTKTGRDIWYDPMTWTNCAGDGALFYPGIDYGMKEPIPTLRIKSIQANSEEYEYLYMIDQKVKEYNAIKGTSLDANTLLQKYYNRLFVDMKPYLDTVVFENTRIELLNVCQTLNNDLEAGIALLQK